MTVAGPDVQTLKRLHRDMLKIRLLEERIVELYPEQEMRCPVHLSIGQEAVAAGVCAALGPNDGAFSGHRSHGHYIAKGGDLNAMLAEIYGRATGCAGGKGGSMHLIDLDAGFNGASPIVGSTIPIAVGAAFATAYRGESSVTVTFFGEGATEEGVFHEAANFAVLHRLPVVFVCENNLYSVYSPLEVRQPPHREVYEQARSYGMPAIKADGNDAAKVYSHALDAVNRARSGNGPTFLEFTTYRWREHSGPNYDNDIGYRTEEEFLEWQRRDPLRALETKMLNAGQLTSSEVEQMNSELRAEIDSAVEFAQTSPYPDTDELLRDVYAFADTGHE